MPYYDEYEKLDRIASPDFIESKGYVHVGQSMDRLAYENMPSHEMVLEFSNELARRLGYTPYADRYESRVAMIAKDPSKAKIDFEAELKKHMK